MGAIGGLASTTADAGLVMEPVFDRVEQVEPGRQVVSIYAPEMPNPATGEPFADADEPGEIATCPAGFPPDAIDVDVLRFENNTRYDITGLELQIVGTADEPEPFDFTVNRDPDVNARFGDVNGDGKLGVSDIFETITVSHDEKTIAFADGVIPVGGIFTDYIYSETSDGKPFLAAIDSRFDGVAVVPLPPALSMFGSAVLGLGLLRVGRRKLF